MNVIEATGLGKRYWTTWALRGCTLAIPSGRVAALVGPNGAGKTTLMHLAVGLTTPAEGRVTVLGGRAAGSPEALNRVAFVAQDVPLYQHLPVKDMMHLARNLNGRDWDQPRADKRLAVLGIPPRRKVGKLSRGQQAQVALTIALARRPEFLVLDEPLAPLDPLARHEFLASVMETVAEDGTSVLFSSHVVAELERIADYLVVLAGGRVQVAGDVETLLAGHQILTGPTPKTPKTPKAVGTVGAQFDVVHAQQGSAQAHLLVRRRTAAAPPAGWQAHPVTLEELVLAYLREPGASALPGPEPLGTDTFTGVAS
jgi:ABC-2 type transport system ATP-binding protein